MALHFITYINFSPSNYRMQSHPRHYYFLVNDNTINSKITKACTAAGLGLHPREDPAANRKSIILYSTILQKKFFSRTDGGDGKNEIFNISEDCLMYPCTEIPWISTADDGCIDAAQVLLISGMWWSSRNPREDPAANRKPIVLYSVIVQKNS